MSDSDDKKVKFEAPQEEKEGKKYTSPRKPQHKKKYHNNSYQKNSKNGIQQYTSKTEEIKDDTFTIGSNMGKKWMTSREAFINYAGRTYGGSVKTSLHRLKMTILHVKRPEEYTDEEYKVLPQRLQDIWKMEYKRYSDMEVKVQDQLIKAYDILWDQCEPALKNKIKLQPTVHVFFNTLFLRNIRQVNKELHLYTNSGKSIIDEMGELPGFGTVWVHRSGIANVLSFHGVKSKRDYHITYNSRIKDAFNVEKPDGSTREFIPSEKGLYYSDFSPMFITPTPVNHKKTGTTLQIETVKGNIAKFSKQDVLRAQLARTFQHTAGHLSEHQMLRIARNNQLKNCPITPRNIRLMRAILGPSIPGLKGKMTRSKQAGVTPETVPVPAHVKEHYQDLTLGMDIMHINKIPFLTTTSRHLHYHAATALPNMQTKHIIDAITALHQFYQLRNYRITHILADGQFHQCKHPIAALHVNLNCVARDEHVPEIERLHRTIKERCRCNIHMVPFKRLPKRLTVGLVRNIIFYLNAFPHPDGLSNELSPYTLVTGKTVDYNLHCSIPFGTYAQTREPTDNTMRARSVGAIAMGPSMNFQGGVLFFSLNTGRELDRSKTDYTILPMPTDAIQRIEHMAQDAPDGILFTDRNNAPFPDDNMDYAHGAIHDPSTVLEHNELQNTNLSTLQQHATQITGVNTNTNTNNTTNDDNDTDENDETTDVISDDIANDRISIEDAEQTEESTPDTHPSHQAENDELPTGTTGVEESTGVEDPDDPDDHNESDSEEDESNEDNQPRRSTRIRNAIDRPMEEQFEYQYLHNGTLTTDDGEEIQPLDTENERTNYMETLNYITQMEQKDNYINDMIMMQYSLKAGLKKFGDDGRKATMKELKQMLTREVFSEIDYKSIPNSEKKKALPILLFLTLKRDGITVKGRACADGRPQKLWTPKHASASPTIAIEALFFTLIMDAKEGRDVATCDLPGHFLQTDMEGEILLRLDGPLALLLGKIDPKRWRKHINMERGRPTIYVRCDKAIYGTVTAALLSYKKLIGHLTDWGFEMNPYEPCCWNKIIEGEQCTVVFHVDDMKLSHKNPAVVTNLIKHLESVYAKTDPMTVVRGPIHHYLGMTINFERKGEVKITMYDYIKRMLDEIPNDMRGTRTTAAPLHLFNTDYTGMAKLDQKAKELFHSLTAQILWLGKRGRPDLQLATAFLCTRVNEPDINDYKKLKHQLMYLQHTAHLPLIMKANGEGTSLYIDGAHAVHADMKGHGGAYATMGKGAVYASSTKSKINTISSTETELISVGEKLPKHLWFRQFAVGQTGEDNQVHTLYQDNKSAILLQNNGRLSCRKGSKHIHIRYFFITDRIKNKEVKVEYCPTEDMIADYFTKPLQGKTFLRFRDMILGINKEDFNTYRQQYFETLKEFGLTNDNTKQVTLASPQECVDNNVALVVG